MGHSDQLDRYRKALGGEYKDRQLVLIYLKTGDQSSYAEVEAKGWAVFKWTDLLRVLREGGDVANEVIRQFTEHIESIEAAVHAYKTRPLDRWDGRAWSGLYMALQESLGQGGWGYVANPSGGFMGFWWGWQDVGDGDQLYLQLEQERLVVKVQVRPEDRRGRVRDLWRDRILRNLPEFKRPKRMGRGRWMTVAVLGGDHRVAGPDGWLDLVATVVVAREITRRVQALVESTL